MKLALLILTCIVLSACGPSEHHVKAQLENANYCDTVEDCELVSVSRCPFGCYIYANKATVTQMQELLQAYENAPRGQKCEYGCIGSSGVECKNNKCVPILE